MLASVSLSVAALVGSTSLVWAGHPSATGPKATVKNGSYFGLHNDFYNVDYVLGIPFAQPPTGDLRLALPVSLNSSFDTRNATELGPGCIEFSVCFR